MTAPKPTWEDAVRGLRERPEKRELVEACYFDDPLDAALQRFARSAEWRATSEFLPSNPGRALDLGAGRGIASFALAQEGWQVVALEPDPSDLVGAGAIGVLEQRGLPIQVVRGYAESLPFPDGSFDVVYGRQVLHHALDLPRLCAEAARVLRPGGVMIAARDHVLDRRSDLPTFLANHSLHSVYGGENAFLLSEYREAITRAGLRLRKVLGPLETAINYFPMTEIEWRAACARPLDLLIGRQLCLKLFDPSHPLGGALLRIAGRLHSARFRVPGRLYTFVAEKPL